jgi:hypothetical protein
MASVKGTLALCLLAACGDIQNFSGEVPPLATVVVQVDGTITDATSLRVALVWGEQWLPEPLCVLPASGSAAAVIAAGCRDPFGFVPQQVDANAAITPGTPESFELPTLPDASLLVGDLTARVGYASLVVYDDRDGDGTLKLARANRLSNPDGPGGSDDTDPMPMFRLRDTVYGASFVSMTQPDQRLAYREGAFVQSAFYPRAGCGDPPPAFSVLAAGGFSASDAIAATLAGMLPQEDPATCSQTAPPEDATIHIPVAAPADVAEVACTESTADSSVRYREPEAMSPDFTGRRTACVMVPTFGTDGSGSGSGTIELIVTGVVDGSDADSCAGLTHYILKGCRETPDCGVPDWDHSLAPPDWWPC